MDLFYEIFKEEIILAGNLISAAGNNSQIAQNQGQTMDIFTDKWKGVGQLKDVEVLYKAQYDWFLSLYGYENENELKKFLEKKKFIIDTGCGLGYKAAWFAKLSPDSIVIGTDISESIYIAAENFKSIPNLFFVRGDIANTPFKNNSIDFVVCDQVIMHTENPEKTFLHLSSITKKGGQFACYVYRKKALPRELIDDYFRNQTHNIPKDEMWKFSEQLTELGKRLSELNVSFESPDIPLLGIKGGKYDVQRFIYWNFLKCFWREDWSFDLSKSTNYDWYAPSNAKRFSREEFESMINENNLKIAFFHEEDACYSGRFLK